MNTKVSIAKNGALISLWYAGYTGCMVYSKKILNVFPFPLTAALLNLVIGVSIAATFHFSNYQKLDVKINHQNMREMIPAAVFHAMGQVFSVFSLKHGSIGIVAVIRATEPVVSTLLLWVTTGTVQTIQLNALLVPIILGVMLCSVDEISFNWETALFSICTIFAFSLSSIYSKSILTKKDGANTISVQDLQAYISFISILLILPAAILFEAQHIRISTAISDWRFFCFNNVFCAVSYHLHNQISLVILDLVDPIILALANTIKRVVVIVVGMVVFGSTMTKKGVFGVILAISSACAFTLLKLQNEKYSKSKDKKA